MTAQNPYRANSLFVGRGAEITAVRRHLAAGQSTLLIGGRRTGKTSLAARLTDVGRPLIVLDAGAWRLDSEASVLQQIRSGIDHALGAKPPRSPYTRESLTRRLKQIGPIAVVIDEADRILGEPWAGSFLSYLRWIDDSALRSLIAFLLIGGPRLAEYRNPDDHGSPPLNTADPVYLEPLDPADISALMAGLPAHDLTLRNIMHWAGGHPWLINRLLAEIWDGREFENAIDRVWDISVRNFKVWHRQVGEMGTAFLRTLPTRGMKMSEFRSGKMLRHREALLRCRYTCLVRRSEHGVYRPGPKLFLDWLSSVQGESRAWDLAISYASENVDIAKAIYDQLSAEFKVFFAPAEAAYLWGEDLNKALPHTYGVDAGFVLVLSSKSYVKKYWTKVEFAAALKSLGEGRLLVVKLDALPPNMPRDVVFMEARPHNLVNLVKDIKLKMAHRGD